MKFKNHEIEILRNILFEISLKGKESRMRTRFVQLLTDHLVNIVNKERAFLIDEYADRNDDGTIRTVKDSPSDIYIQDDKKEEFYKEFHDLMNEDFHIEENDSNKMMLSSVAEIMLNSDIEVAGEVAVLYDKWCFAFEELIERYSNSENNE